MRQVAALEEDPPGGGLQQAYQQPTEGGLAATALTHHAERLAAAQLQVHAVQGGQPTAPAEQFATGPRVLLAQPLHAQQRLARRLRRLVPPGVQPRYRGQQSRV